MKPIPSVTVGWLAPVRWPRKGLADYIRRCRRRGDKIVRKVRQGVTIYYSQSKSDPYLFSITKP